jgi:hypothetical protein
MQFICFDELDIVSIDILVLFFFGVWVLFYICIFGSYRIQDSHCTTLPTGRPKVGRPKVVWLHADACIHYMSNCHCAGHNGFHSDFPGLSWTPQSITRWGLLHTFLCGVMWRLQNFWRQSTHYTVADGVPAAAPFSLSTEQTSHGRSFTDWENLSSHPSIRLPWSYEGSQQYLAGILKHFRHMGQGTYCAHALHWKLPCDI